VSQNPAGLELLIQALPTQNSSKEGKKKIGVYSYFLIEKSPEKQENINLSIFFGLKLF
jgi:hypothetical protein